MTEIKPCPFNWFNRRVNQIRHSDEGVTFYMSPNEIDRMKEAEIEYSARHTPASPETSTASDPAVREALDLVNEQANDEGLWFIAETAPEAYLQQELRKLHHLIERAALKAQLPSQWQTIDNAPIDGTNIIIFCPDNRKKVKEAWAEYDDVLKEYYFTNSDGNIYSPTHWMPLPTPPIKAQLGE